METDAFSIEILFDFLSTNPKIVSIIGMDKNVGKTTLLNFLLKGMAESTLPTLVLSIGRDGEPLDSVENTKKPEITIYKGGCFLTIKELIKTPSSVEILESFDVKVSGSKILLARALQDIKIQLINPANQKILSWMIKKSMDRCGSCTVFIDGALDRVSHGSSTLIDGVFVCAGVQAEGTLSQIIEKTRWLITKLENEECSPEIEELIINHHCECGSILIRNNKIIGCIPGTLLDSLELDEKIKNNDIIYTTGVVTDKIIKRFIDRDLSVTIVLIDGTQCHISQRSNAMMVKKGIALRVLHKIPVYGISVNSVGIRRSMNPSKVLKAFRDAFENKWVIDTTYIM